MFSIIINLYQCFWKYSHITLHFQKELQDLEEKNKFHLREFEQQNLEPGQFKSYFLCIFTCVLHNLTLPKTSMKIRTKKHLMCYNRAGFKLITFKVKLLD